MNLILRKSTKGTLQADIFNPICQITSNRGSSNDYTGIQGNFRFPPPLERMKALIPDVFAAMNAYVKAGCTVSNVHTKPDCD
ncbi:unnamed protein product, partial [Linum tenue]